VVEGLDANENALLLTGALESAVIPYAIGGALAYGVWSAPRGTHDVDLNIFLAEDHVDAVLDVLMTVGCVFDREDSHRRAREGAVVVGRLAGMRIDLFFATIPFSWEAATTRARVDTSAGSRWYLSAEATALFKLLFFRTKDKLDLDNLLQVRGELLDHAYIRRWLVDMMGPDDERVVFWDFLLAGGHV
jgi:hypothetical protein